MKKIFALAIAAIMAVSASATAFAADSTIDQDSRNQNADTAVKFTVDPTYTVTIPAEVVLEKTGTDVITYEKDLTITASAGVRLLEGKNIKVTMDSCFELTAAGTNTTLPYTVKVDNQEITAANNEVALFTTSTVEQTKTLRFAADNPTYAGDYSGTVTFNIAIA